MLVDTISLELYRNTRNWCENGQMFLHDCFWMLRGFDIRNREFLFSSQPYRLQENRVVWVRRGWASYSFNLVDYKFEAGDLVVFYADTLVEKKSHSDDFEFDAFRYDGVVSSLSDVGVDVTSEHPSFIRLQLNRQTESVVDHHFSLLWEIVHQQPFLEDSVALIIRSLLLYVNHQHGQVTTGNPVNRQADMLRRFVDLVSRYAGKERTVPFYADKLCIAPHYLSTLIKKLSGRTVMQWINETAVKEVKVWLAYSDETLTQISDRLCFPCSASLVRFFKRETGMTPGQYRTQIHPV